MSFLVYDFNFITMHSAAMVKGFRLKNGHHGVWQNGWKVTCGMREDVVVRTSSFTTESRASGSRPDSGSSAAGGSASGQRLVEYNVTDGPLPPGCRSRESRCSPQHRTNTRPSVLPPDSGASRGRTAPPGRDC